MRQKQEVIYRKLKVKSLGVAIFLTFAFSLSTAMAQEAIPATGGNASGSGGSVNYSVGQVVYTTNTGINGSVEQGVQQPYEISAVNGIEDPKGISLECNVYPNPTTDLLILKIENFKSEGFTYQLYDVSGKFLENGKVESNETKVVMSNLVPAIYFLKVIHNQNIGKTFTIIKN